MKLSPVITRKTFGQNSTSLLNTAKKPTAKVRLISITSEKSAPPPLRKGTDILRGSTASSRSKASSDFSTKQSPRSIDGLDGMSMCKVCQRIFNALRIKKHESKCKKTTSKKRKVVDTTKQRVKGTQAKVCVKKSAKTTKKPEPETPKKSDWRRKHEECIQAIRSAKQMHLAKGRKFSNLPPPPAASVDPDYVHVQCPSCKLIFNRAACVRHIPKCISYQSNKPKTKNAINKNHF